MSTGEDTGGSGVTEVRSVVFPSNLITQDNVFQSICLCACVRERGERACGQ